MSATGKRSQQRAFTLLEVTLVLVVIGVMLSLAMVASAPNPAADLQREARRLQAVLQMAAEEAMMQGIEMALSISGLQGTDAGYQFLVLDIDDLNWLPLQQPQFEFHGLGDSMSMEIAIDGRQVDRNRLRQLQRLQALQSEPQLQPALVLLSSGETTPFTIRLNHPQVERAVTVSSDGVSGIVLR